MSLTGLPVASYIPAVDSECKCTHTRHLLNISGYGGPCQPIQQGPNKGTVMCYACWAACERPACALALDDNGIMRILDFDALDRLYLEGSITDSQAWEAVGQRAAYDRPSGLDRQENDHS